MEHIPDESDEVLETLRDIFLRGEGRYWFGGFGLAMLVMIVLMFGFGIRF